MPTHANSLLLVRTGILSPSYVFDQEMQCTEGLDQLLASENELRKTTGLAVDELFRLIPLERDRDRRGKLLRIKRAIFNGEWKAALDVADVGDLHAVRSLHDVVTRGRDLELGTHEFNLAYQDAEIRSAGILSAICEIPHFVTALGVASPDTRRAVREWKHSGTISLMPRRLGRSLSRYVTRCAMKATPFAGFAFITHAKLQTSDPSSGLALHVERGTNQQGFRANKMLLPRLVAYCQSSPELRSILRISAFPSFVGQGGSRKVLAFQNGTELVHKVPEHKVIECIFGLLDTHGSLTLSGLQRNLRNGLGSDESDDTLVVFVNGLTERGLLELGFDVPEGEANYVSSLKKHFCSAATSDDHSELLAILSSIERAVDQNDSDVSISDELIDELRVSLASKLPPIAQSDRNPRSLVYRDLAGSEAGVLQTSASCSAFSAFERLIDTLMPLSPIAGKRAEMRCVFDRVFFDRTEVPFIEFFQAFYQHFYSDFRRQISDARKANLATFPEDLNNPLQLSLIDRQQSARRAVRRFIADRADAAGSAEEICITSAELSGIIGDLCVPIENQSIAAFCSVVSAVESNRERLVLEHGTLHPGYGKYFSRFLHLLPDHVTESIRRENLSVGSDPFVEIELDHNFNGNLRPTLCSRRIVYRRPSPNAERSDCIPLSSLQVVPDDDDRNNLYLIDGRDGSRVIPVDLGFLSARLQRPSYELLTWFSPTCSWEVPVPSIVRRAAHPSLSRVITVPRIVFEDSVVLSRRSWLVPSACFPEQSKLHAKSIEERAKVFREVHRWAKEHRLPQRCYIRALSAASGAGGFATTDAPSQPQFVSFFAPLLVDLLVDMMHNSRALIIQEALPASPNLSNYGEEQRATEILLQFTVTSSRETALANQS